MEEKIDILLTTYNGEKFIREQLESILNQSYSNFRLLISDDNSQDDTPEILAEYEKYDERIQVFRQEKNLGYIKNFEFLIGKVESDLYMLSDQDDVWLRHKIERAWNTLKNEKADLVFSDLTIVNEKLEEVIFSFGDYMKLNKKIKKCINTYKLNYLYNCVTGCTLLTKKKYIDKIIPLPDQTKHIAHDHWIALLTSMDGKLVYIEEKDILYRQHGKNQIGTEKSFSKLKNLEQIRELFIDVKLGVFGTYVQHNERFPKKLQNLNRKAYEYYQMLKTKRYINLKSWNIFHELYKNETIMYYVKNFLILNLPIITHVIGGNISGNSD